MSSSTYKTSIKLRKCYHILDQGIEEMMFGLVTPQQLWKIVLENPNNFGNRLENERHQKAETF